MRKLVSIIISCILWAIVISCAEKEPEYDEQLIAIHNLLSDYDNAENACRMLSEIGISDFHLKHNKAYYAY